MRRLFLYGMILILVWVVPTGRADVAKLRPVEVIAVYKVDDRFIVVTDTDDRGEGNTIQDALEDMRASSPAIIYLDTAEYLLVEADAVETVDMLREELKPSIRICSTSGEVDLKAAAEYLPVHDILPTLRRWNSRESLPKLLAVDGRLKLAEMGEIQKKSVGEGIG